MAKRPRPKRPPKPKRATPDPIRAAVIARAQAGDLLNGEDLQVIFHLSRSRFYVLQKAGAFEPFALQPKIGNYCYSGLKVIRYLDGEPFAEPRLIMSATRFQGAHR